MAKVFTITEGLENMGALKTGGQGSVYKARRVGEIITAVKLLPTPIHSESEQDKNFISFQNEVGKLKRVNEEPNPNVVKILSSGITDSGSFPFIEMEFIEGPDMEELLKPPHDPIFTVKEAIKVAEQLSNALGHCHRLDVKHGDMKSNNVKFNKHTGNYMLIDFGLSAMSDEQRRTSLRHAGAIEFMAPEQSAGQLLFQTDIYGFGIILFELLAGQVPFPLTDGSETARNLVMVSHMEKQPPDLKELRRRNLPDSWPSEKKDREMQIPEWLLSMIYRCLRKKPEERFANGIELHNYIFVNSVNVTTRSQFDGPTEGAWQQQAEKLLKEKQQLQQQLAMKDAELQRLRSQPQSVYTGPERIPGQDDYQRPKKNTAWLVAFILTLLVASGLAYALIQSEKKQPEEKKPEATNTNALRVPDQLSAVGDYRVKSAKTFFHNTPDETTRRGAFLSKNDPITALGQENGFIYTEFTNSRGQVSKGWLKLSDLMTVEEWQQQQNAAPVRPTDEEIRNQLNAAAGFVQNNQSAEALTIYNNLLPFNVPEAFYGAANLALQGKNNALDCDQAMAMLRRASDAGNLPAKRTLGFLHMFAENEAVLSMNGYNRCVLDKNFSRARMYLSQAANGGDTLAQRLLNELNINQQNNPQQ
jgi:eukaryotic-like serine/threonine-protein kinase